MKKSNKWTLKWLREKLLFVLPILLFVSVGKSQNQALPLNHQSFLPVERAFLINDEIVHSSFKPIIETQLPDFINREKLLPYLSFEEMQGSLVGRKLFREHLIRLDSGAVQMSIDPIINFEYGEEQKSDPREISLYKNTRGFLLQLNLGDKVSVRSTFRENQANLPFYLSQRTRTSQVAFGQGRVKNFNDEGFDFSMASSRISYSPNDWLNLQAGHGKHFIGDGHRSLLLSDLGFNYPFLKIQTQWVKDKIQYQNLFTLFQDLNRLETESLGEGLFERKQGIFHFLEYKPNNRLAVGLFEGVIFPSLDTARRVPVGANYWIPMIFLNTLMEGESNGGNSMQGINLNYSLFSLLKLYSQVACFDEKIKSLSYQLGGKWFLHENFTLQAEYNSNNGDQFSGPSLYHHYNEPLSHPVMFESEEYLWAVYFRKNRFMTRAVANQIIGEQYDVKYLDICQAYIINPSYNFTFNVGAQYREALKQPAFYRSQTESFYVYIGLSTNFQNLYFNY